jgi:outer membrane protein assembly factor BamD
MIIKISKPGSFIHSLLQQSVAFLVIAFVFSVFLGCAKSRKGEMLSASESLHHAIALYENEDYLDAEDEFSAITLNYPGSVVVDSAEFYLGETHFALREYILAASSYQRVVTQYPRSPLVPISQYKVAECYYLISPSYSLDQDYTRKAITEFQRFLEDFPDNDRVPQGEKYLYLCRQKLAKKAYKTGILYIKMNEYPAAVLYFDDILDNYYDTSYAPLALYYKGIALEKNKQYKEAKETFVLFLAKYPRHSFYDRAGEQLKELENIEREEPSVSG